MRSSIKAFLLSTFVFPGLGQLYKQERRKGIILILVANFLFGLMLLAFLILFSQEYLASYYPAPLTGEVLAPLLLRVLRHPFFLLPCLMLVGLWGYAAVDAGFRPGPTPTEE